MAQHGKRSEQPLASATKGGITAFLLLCLAEMSGSGCVAVNVGRPETFRHTVMRREESPNPVRSNVAEARVQLQQRGNRVAVQVAADMADEFEQSLFKTELVVRRQKKLAFGLFPAAAENVYMPRGALVSAQGIFRDGFETSPEFRAWYGRGAEPGMGAFVSEQTLAWFGLFGTISVCATVESLVLWPFTDWGCTSHDFVDGDCFRQASRNGKIVMDASESPKLRALAAFPEQDREKIGAHTCFDVEHRGEGFSHWGLVGFHKFQAVFVEIPDEEEGKESGTEIRIRKAAIPGPFEVELAIPGLGYSDKRRVEKGEKAVVFELPEGRREGRIEARVSVRECVGEAGTATPTATRQAVRKLAGQASRFDVNLRAPAGGWTQGGFPARLEGEPSEAICDIVEIRPSRTGKYVVRAKVRDPSRILDAAWEIEDDIRRRIREDFASRHPEIRVEDIRDMVEWTTEGEDGATLAFTGWAFSGRPLESGWKYDARTRRGIVRVAVSDGIPEQQVRQWAKDHIGEIVADKNVGIGTEGDVPEGTGFRWRADRFENGVLTVEFEAVK